MHNGKSLMPPRPLRDVLDEYAQKKLRRANPQTRAIHEFALRHWERMVGHEPSTDDLNDDALELYHLGCHLPSP